MDAISDLRIFRPFIYDPRHWGGGKSLKKVTHLAKKVRVSHVSIDNFGLRPYMAMIRCALCCPDPGQCVRYPQHGHSMLRTSSKASQT